MDRLGAFLQLSNPGSMDGKASDVLGDKWIVWVQFHRGSFKLIPVASHLLWTVEYGFIFGLDRISLSQKIGITYQLRPSK